MTRLSRSQRGWGDGGYIQKSLSCCYQDLRAWFFKYHFSIFIPNKYCFRSLERGVTVMMMVVKGLPWLSALHSSTLSSCPCPAPAPSAPRPASAQSLLPQLHTHGTVCAAIGDCLSVDSGHLTPMCPQTALMHNSSTPRTDQPE